jgi:ribosomal protein S10
MKDLSVRVRIGDPVALRKFIHTVRRSPTHQAAWSELGLEQRTYYRLVAMLRGKGHTL